MIQILGFFVGVAAFPCFLMGIIMLISFLTCDYIEKFVVKTFCSIKNRRRRYRERTIPGERSGPKRKKSRSSNEMATRTAAIEPETAGPSASLNDIPLEAPRAHSSELDEPPPDYYECTRTPPAGHYKAKSE